MNSLQKASTLALLLITAGITVFVVTHDASQRSSTTSPVVTWNPTAIQTTYAGVRVQQIDPSNAAIVFFYDVDNKTDSDYQLSKGPDVVVMSKLKSSGALSAEKPVALTASAFVPTKKRTRVAVEVAKPFSWPSRMDASAEDRLRQLVAQEITDLDGFVIFDQSHRYEIDLPGSWPTGENKAAHP
jgi:hypothetical protein